MMKTADFARRAGVTVRTLRYYDRVDLLCPRRTPAGHRVYEEGDLLRLQQIRVLQFVGLTLEQIRHLLQQPRGLQESLQFQLHLLREKQQQMERVIRILERAAEGDVDLALVIKRIERENTMDWMKEFYDEATWKKLADRAATYTPEQQQVDQQRWLDLFAEVRASMQEDPASEHVQSLARRWKALIDEFTQGDPKVLDGLRAMHARSWTRGLRACPPNADLKDFLRVAMEVGGLKFLRHD